MATIPLDLETDTVPLPPPVFPPAASLEGALKNRRSERVFRDEPLALETVSTLLWAGCGINHQCKAQEQSFFAAADAAFAAQNVALYCAGVGLSTVVRALIDRRRLAGALRLTPTERIVLAQSVGLPATAR